jgi:hypothetical protein
MAAVDYDQYSNYVGSICDIDNLSGFKVNPNYTYMLEHVTKSLGKQYLTGILTYTSITEEEVAAFCAINDAIGNPSKQIYEELFVSPSSLRYVFHAHLILTQMKAVGQLVADVVEVGGGYGGLCIAVKHFAPKYGITINSYTICDLPNIIRLQKIYIGKAAPEMQVEFVDATTFGQEIPRANMFLVSNYCFSEITRANQDSYRQKLFPKVAHGFMAWNMIPVYNFGFTTRVESEFPNTGGPMNKYVYF